MSVCLSVASFLQCSRQALPRGQYFCYYYFYCYFIDIVIPIIIIIYIIFITFAVLIHIVMQFLPFLLFLLLVPHRFFPLALPLCQFGHPWASTISG